MSNSYFGKDKGKRDFILAVFWKNDYPLNISFSACLSMQHIIQEVRKYVAFWQILRVLEGILSRICKHFWINVIYTYQNNRKDAM